MAPPKSLSDTISITSDGRAVVDVPRLLAKDRMQQMIREMRSKTTFVHARRETTQLPRPQVQITTKRG